MLSTKNTDVAVMLEATPYEYETPTNTDFMPVLDSFAFANNFDSLANNEMAGGLDKKPSRPTTQTGSLTIPLHLKGSGAANTKPWYDELLRCGFDTATNPFNGAAKTIDGNAALLVIEGTPAVGQFDITVAQATHQAGDILLVDVSDDGSGEWEQAEIESATFSVDHETIVLTDDLSAAPAVGNEIQLISRVKIDTSPGLAVGEMIAVNVDQTGSDPSYEHVLVTTVSGTTTQTVTVLPYLSQEPLDGEDVVGGFTYKPKESGHDTLSASVFMDCRGQDGVRLDFAGCRPNVSIQNAETGNVAEIHFAMEIVKWQVSSTGTNLTTLGLTPNKGPDHEAPLCLGAVICLDSHRNIVHTQKLELDLGLTVAKRKSMIPSTGFRSSRYSERGVTGKFDLDLDDVSQYTKWTARETSPLLMQFQDGNQVIVIIVPFMKRTNVEPQDSDGIRTQDISWEADFTTTIKPVYIGFFDGGY